MDFIARDVSYLLAGRFYRMALTCWGDPAAPVVVCVHGLSRNARDFDVLAAALAERFYVICVDLPGRGRSEWLAAGGLYAPGSYVVALGHLLAWVGRPVRWVGTSLGGICGMLLAAAGGAPIERMVLNDIGPFLPRAALARIAAYVGDVPDFADVAGVEGHLRRVHAAFGALSDAQWEEMARHSQRVRSDGRVTLHFDPALTEPLLASAPADVDMWGVWEAIRAPVLTLRGAESDLLLPEVFGRMLGKSAGHVVAGAGHAPALMDAATVGVVGAFLDGVG